MTKNLHPQLHPGPWNRRPDESAGRFEAFVAYLNLGPRRSVRRAIQARYGTVGGGRHTRWRRWAVTFAWVERAEAFDRYVAAQETAAVVERRRELANRRLDREILAHEELVERAAALRAKIDALMRMPNTDAVVREFAPDGGIVREVRVRGVSPSEIAAVSREWREVVAAAVNGHVRVSRHGRLPDPARSSGAAGRVTVLAGEEYPTSPH